MPRPLPLFPVTLVGSWPRSTGLLRAQRLHRQGRLGDTEFRQLADAAVLDSLRCQEEAGVDLVTDGEQRRDNFYSFVAGKLDGVRLMALAEMLDVVEDRAGFERILSTLDVPAQSISNPTCVGRIARREPLALGELEFLRQHTDRPIKVPLPGPYLLTRAMYVAEVTGRVYASKEDLAEDVVVVLRAEIADLIRAGAAFIQLDEPVLTELVFTQGRTRTFMCAALAARKDPAEELEFAVSLINRVTEGFDDVAPATSPDPAPGSGAATGSPTDPTASGNGQLRPGPGLASGPARIGLHICRGNWSRNEATLLSGGYAPLRPYLERLRVRQLVLEYATPRAGEIVPLAGKELGLGVVNPRVDHVETPAEIVAAVQRALQHYPPEAIFLNPDCGFGTFSARPLSSPTVAFAKLRAMAEAARRLRGG
jgi:5-methyltetrahydropteroyltriglutamate--homocysteine methyltransferase